jgi:hypothetical protein
LIKYIIRSAVMPGLLFLVAVSPCAFATDGSAFISGAGTDSCATWTSETPEAQLGGSQWVLGFLSGMNVVVPSSEQVGQDAMTGILEKVRTICQEHPSWLLARAAVRPAAGRDPEKNI